MSDACAAEEEDFTLEILLQAATRPEELRGMLKELVSGITVHFQQPPSLLRRPLMIILMAIACLAFERDAYASQGVKKLGQREKIIAALLP